MFERRTRIVLIAALCLASTGGAMAMEPLRQITRSTVGSHKSFEHPDQTDANARFQNRQAAFQSASLTFQGRRGEEVPTTTFSERELNRRVNIENQRDQFQNHGERKTFVGRTASDFSGSDTSNRFENIRMRFENPAFQRFNVD